jgi:hypothetical protein
MATNDQVQPSDCVFESLFAEANMLHAHASALEECSFIPLFLEIVKLKKGWSCTGSKDDMRAVQKVGSVFELESLLLYLSYKGIRKFAQSILGLFVYCFGHYYHYCYLVHCCSYYCMLFIACYSLM